MNKIEEEFLSSLKALCVRYNVEVKYIDYDKVYYFHGINLQDSEDDFFVSIDDIIEFMDK